MPKSNLTVRILTTLGLLPLLLALLFVGPAWAWYLLVVAASAVASAELFAMTHPGDRVAQTVGVVTTLGVSGTVYQMPGDAHALMILVMSVCLIGGLIPLWRLGDVKTSALRMMAGIAGPLYVGVLLTTLGLLRRDQHSLGSSYVFMALSFAWLGDTGGYFFGKYLGRRKLYPAVSPKKTVAGLVGAMGASSLGGLGVHLWLLPSVPLTHAIGLGVSAAFVWSGWLVVSEAIHWNERTPSTLHVPLWIYYAALPLAFGLNCIFTIERAVEDLRGDAGTKHVSLSD